MIKNNKKRGSNKTIKKGKNLAERIKRFLVVSFLILAPIYVLFAAFLYFNQANFFYYPDKQDFEKCESFEDYQKLKSNGTRLYYKEKSKDEVIILYHGNTGSACDRTHLKRIFDKTKKSVIFVEYSGYANDPKVPSKKMILQDAQNIETFVRNKGFKKVTVMGESIGSGPASFHSKIGQVDRLLLTVPFARIIDVARYQYPIFPISIMIKEDYDNIESLKDYKGDILIIYGSEDEIIPARFSEELCDVIDTPQKECLSIFGAGHNNLFSFVEAVERIEEFIKD